MPIPTDGPWPPPAVAEAYHAYRDWDAWYTGDADRLRAVYQERAAAADRLGAPRRVRPSQMSGGIVGLLSRWLWGQPHPQSGRDGRLHVPLPADLSATSANLLYAEPPKLTVGDPSGIVDDPLGRGGDQAPAPPPAAVAPPGTARDRAAAEARLEQLTEDGLAVLLLHAAEAASAFGDVYLRPVVDAEVLPGRAFPTAVHADGALPVIRWGRLVEVTFWSTVADEGQTVWRLLEHHARGSIEYALHKGGPHTLGRRMALADRPDLPAVADLVDQVDDTGRQATGLRDRLDVVRIPNAGPQRRWRNHPHLRYLGRSDYDGNEPIFDQIDEVWSSWMRDIRLAKGRIVVPAVMLQDNGPGAGATWDPDREVYSAINALPKDLTGGGITTSQFEIRHEEHRATADALVEVALRHAGLSSQTLGDEKDAGVVTATEIQARERQSFITRGNRIQAHGPALAEAVELLLAVERVHGLSDVDPFRPALEFGDSVSESPEATARTVELLNRAEAISFDTRVRMVHPDWTDDQVGDEVRRLMAEQGRMVEDPDTFRGTATGGGQPPTDADQGDQGADAGGTGAD